MLTKEEMLAMLHQDVVPALGCTEPVCVALAAADAARAVGGSVCKVDVAVNAGIYKNGMSAGIPNFDKVGLNYAAALGAVLKNPDKGLELLEAVDAHVRAKVQSLADSDCVTVRIQPEAKGLYVSCAVTTENGTGLSVIRDSHTNIVFTSVNDTIVYQKSSAAKQGDDRSVNVLKQMTIAQIRQLVDTATEDELAFMMDGVEMNERLAAYGNGSEDESCEHRKQDTGIGIANTFMKNIGTPLMADDLQSRVMMKVAAAAENRLDGCPYPTMSSSGAGTKGLVVILPIAEMAKTIGASRENTIKALAFGHLVNRYINAHVAKLSALCMCCMASSTAACAAMTWLLGGNDTQIGFAIRNMTGTVTGMICDGGKVGCALKVALGSSAAVMNAMLAVNNVALRASDGICAHTPEDCIQNISRIGNPGMALTDQEILRIMLEKQ